ncbi:hypothetical protein ACLOJK_032463 [Asimina triloba]
MILSAAPILFFYHAMVPDPDPECRRSCEAGQNAHRYVLMGARHSVRTDGSEGKEESRPSTAIFWGARQDAYMDDAAKAILSVAFRRTVGIRRKGKLG